MMRVDDEFLGGVTNGLVVNVSRSQSAGENKIKNLFLVFKSLNLLKQLPSQ